MSTHLVYPIYFVLALGLALTSTASAADPSLVGWWRLDDGSGDTALDSSDYGNHGTLNGGPQWVAGKLGGALQLDGVDDFVPNELAAVRAEITGGSLPRAAAPGGTTST